MSREGKIDLYYGDEAHVCSEGYVPYGWQFPGEDIRIHSEKACKLNLFGFINRQGNCWWRTTENNIDAQFILEYVEDFSFQINRKTFLVLDNARVYKAKPSGNASLIGKKEDCTFSFSPHILHI